MLQYNGVGAFAQVDMQVKLFGSTHFPRGTSNPS